MKKVRLSYSLMVIMLLCSSAYAGVKWYNMKEGMQKALDERKPMIVDFFFGEGCARCEALQKKVYDNAGISKKIMEGFIPIRIDLAKKLDRQEEELGNRFGFKNDCLLLFLDYKGNIITGPDGKKLRFAETVEPGKFMEYLDFINGMKVGP